jgi:hypothetical protein
MPYVVNGIGGRFRSSDKNESQKIFMRHIKLQLLLVPDIRTTALSETPTHLPLLT